MKHDGVLRVSVGAMAVALASMLVCLSWPSPRTIGVFLGFGMPLALASVIVFVLYVVRDLHRRRAL